MGIGVYIDNKNMLKSKLPSLGTVLETFIITTYTITLEGRRGRDRMIVVLQLNTYLCFYFVK